GRKLRHSEFAKTLLLKGKEIFQPAARFWPAQP
ncbi:MAG: hypothetical protein ACI853_000971, partial [Paracoccaceae bacterium]